MKYAIAVCFLLVLFSRCKTHSTAEANKPNGPADNPGSCRIEATIIRILLSDSQDTADICFKNPCDAIVRVDRIKHCGSAASVTPDENGEIAVHFSKPFITVSDNSTAPSKEGLKAGSHFSALVESHLAIGDKMNYVIHSYEAF
jgi:hypothetical protein